MNTTDNDKNFEAYLEKFKPLIRDEGGGNSIFDEKSVVKYLNVHPNGARQAKRDVPRDIQNKLFENALRYS